MFTAEIHPIFPTPVLTSSLDRDFSEEELNFLLNLDRRDNNFNESSETSYVLDYPVMERLKGELLIHVDNFFKNTINPSEKVKNFITQSWVNYTKKGGSHHIHAHPNSIISGVLYIQALADYDSINFIKDKKEMFEIETKNYNLFNSGSWVFPAETGKLILFPSYLRHAVQTVTGNHLRVSLSFNTFLKGPVGKEISLTRLTLS